MKLAKTIMVKSYQLMHQGSHLAERPETNQTNKNRKPVKYAVTTLCYKETNFSGPKDNGTFDTNNNLELPQTRNFHCK
jgi:hypothetical protein